MPSTLVCSVGQTHALISFSETHGHIILSLYDRSLLQSVVSILLGQQPAKTVVRRCCLPAMAMNPATSCGRIPAKVSLAARARGHRRIGKRGGCGKTSRRRRYSLPRLPEPIPPGGRTAENHGQQTGSWRQIPLTIAPGRCERVAKLKNKGARQTSVRSRYRQKHRRSSNRCSTVFSPCPALRARLPVIPPGLKCAGHAAKRSISAINCTTGGDRVGQQCQANIHRWQPFGMMPDPTIGCQQRAVPSHSATRRRCKLIIVGPRLNGVQAAVTVARQPPCCSRYHTA